MSYSLSPIHHLKISAIGVVEDDINSAADEGQTNHENNPDTHVAVKVFTGFIERVTHNQVSLEKTGVRKHRQINL